MRIGKASVALALGVSCALAIADLVFADTQQCNTACQTRMTDCILGCDGKISCELDCKGRAVTCVEACSSDAGPPSRSQRESSDSPDASLADAKDAARADAPRMRAVGDAAALPTSRDR